MWLCNICFILLYDTQNARFARAREKVKKKTKKDIMEKMIRRKKNLIPQMVKEIWFLKKLKLKLVTQ